MTYQKPCTIIFFVLGIIFVTVISNSLINVSPQKNNIQSRFRGEYTFTTNFQKTSGTQEKSFEKGKIFDGKISFSENGTFFMSGTDLQTFPWRKEPQNRHEEEKGTYHLNGNSIQFASPEALDGGWSFIGNFNVYTFKSREDVMRQVGTRNIQYHLLERDSEYILLINPYFEEK